MRQNSHVNLINRKILIKINRLKEKNHLCLRFSKEFFIFLVMFYFFLENLENLHNENFIVEKKIIDLFF